MAARTNLVILFGGKSGEHEVSVASAAYIIETLHKTGSYHLLPVGITKDGRWFAYEGNIASMRAGTWLEQGPVFPASLVADTSKHNLYVERENLTQSIKVDCVFPVLHGPNGEDGTIQGMLELAGIPFVGCGMAASALAMDKVFANTIFDHNQIPGTPWHAADYAAWRRDKNLALDAVTDGLTYPLFVKPARGGSSLGITKVVSREALPSAMEIAFTHDRKVIVEQGVRGRELEIALLGGYGAPILSPVGEIIPDREFYDYDSKYEAQSTSQLFVPADIDGETLKTIRNLAVRAWRALDCYGMARIDFFLADDGQVLLNEINTIPGFVSISMYPRLLRAAGYRDEEPLEELIRLAFQRQESMK